MLRRTAAVLGATLVWLGCSTTPVHLRPWIEVRTSNFEIFSPRPESEVVELARDLELFRSVVEKVTGQPIRESRVPLLVYALDRGTYRRFDAPRAAGYFVLTPRQSTIVLGQPRGGTGDLIRHEYVHFLLHNEGSFAYPPWYDEGFAEFLGNAELKPNFVEIGHANQGRIRSLGVTGWMPLESVMSRRNLAGMTGQQMGSFYSQSWALLHYLNLGREGANTPKELTRYLAALRDGTDHEDAVRNAFGMDSAAIGRKLRKYIARGRFIFLKAPRDRFDPGEEPVVRRLSSQQVAISLGELSLARQAYREAESQFTAVLAQDSDNSRALAGYATALANTDRWQEAEAWFGKALASNPNDALAQLDYANYLHALARGAKDAGQRSEHAKLARRHYVASWKLNDSIPETYAAYGSTFLLEGEDPGRGLATLEHAHSMLPSSVEIKLLLARLYAKLGRKKEARDLASVASTWNHTQETEDDLRELLD